MTAVAISLAVYSVAMTVVYVRSVRKSEEKTRWLMRAFSSDQSRMEGVWRERLSDLKERHQQQLSFLRAGIEDKNDLPSHMYMDKGTVRFRSRWLSPSEEASYQRQIMSGHRSNFEPGDA
tara:strand:+ start:742 stop:1101 length:360 start_codon:yes stop_codon:yes gene_type:complete